MASDSKMIVGTVANYNTLIGKTPAAKNYVALCTDGGKEGGVFYNGSQIANNFTYTHPLMTIGARATDATSVIPANGTDTVSIVEKAVECDSMGHVQTVVNNTIAFSHGSVSTATPSGAATTLTVDGTASNVITGIATNNGHVTSVTTTPIKVAHHNSGATAGTYGSDTASRSLSPTSTSISLDIPRLTVNAEGHITGVKNSTQTIGITYPAEYNTITYVEGAANNCITCTSTRSGEVINVRVAHPTHTSRNATTWVNSMTVDGFGHVTALGTSALPAGANCTGTVTSVAVQGSNGLTGSGTVTTSGTITLSHAAGALTSGAKSDNGKHVSSITLDGYGHVSAVGFASAYSHPTYTTRSGGPSAGGTLAFGGTFTVPAVTSDGTGHVTGVTDRTFTLPAAPATYTHPNSGVTAGSKGGVSGDTITVPTITVDAQGHITALGSASYTVDTGGGTLTGSGSNGQLAAWNGSTSLTDSGVSVSNGSLTATSYYASSDERLKENIKPIEVAESIEGKSFNFKETPSKKTYGYIAQEVQKVLPEVVSEREDGMLTVNYEAVFTYLIQKHENEIAELKAEIVKLRSSK